MKVCFADDVYIIARNKKVSIETYTINQKHCKIQALRVINKKAKYMKMHRKNSQTRATLAINNELKFYEITEFKYLRSINTCDNMVAVEIKARLTAGNICYFPL